MLNQQNTEHFCQNLLCNEVLCSSSMIFDLKNLPAYILLMFEIFMPKEKNGLKPSSIQSNNMRTSKQIAHWKADISFLLKGLDILSHWYICLSSVIKKLLWLLMNYYNVQLDKTFHWTIVVELEMFLIQNTLSIIFCWKTNKLG